MHIYIGTPSSPEGGGQARGSGIGKKAAQGAKKSKSHDRSQNHAITFIGKRFKI